MAVAILMVEEEEEAAKMVLNLPPGMLMVEGKAFLLLSFLLQDNVMAILTYYKV